MIDLFQSGVLRKVSKQLEIVGKSYMSDFLHFLTAYVNTNIEEYMREIVEN
jgi:hypothetical protein